jgi:outer membrane protein OmpA-like peptidoglycan-associated protein
MIARAATFFTVGLLTLGMVACAPRVEVEEIPVTANPSDEISEIAKLKEEARSKQVDVLAPTAYASMSRELRLAIEARDRGDDAEAILDHVELSRAWLRQATNIAELSRKALGQAVEARQDAIDANAATVLKDDFAAADAQLKRATEEIEEDDLALAQKTAPELAKRYAELELRALKESNLSAARANLQRAVNEGAEESAPRSLAEARGAYQQAEAFIEANRKDKAGIQQAAATALDLSERAVRITREAKVANRRDAESMILELEARERTATAAGERAASATEQVEEMSAELSSRQRQEQLIENARTQFSATEAEVLQRGNQIILRLRGLTFDPGTATLSSDDFTLLNKALSVAQSFAPAAVIIEGHTDSSGGRKVNQTLSAQRAKAVESYFTAQQPKEGMRFSAVGVGSSRPLASNETRQGRALNRRVDLLIMPQGAGAAH